MNQHVFRLMQCYRSRGVLVDTNILLLLLIGSFDRSLITKFKRTGSRFSVEDFNLLRALLFSVRSRRHYTQHPFRGQQSFQSTGRADKSAVLRRFRPRGFAFSMKSMLPARMRPKLRLSQNSD